MKKEIVSNKSIIFLNTLSYDKVYVLSNNNETIIDTGKVIILTYNILEEGIEEVYRINKDELILLPFFSGDELAKNSIDIYNKTFSSNIKYTNFKDKDMMNDMMKSISPKRSSMYSYEKIQTCDYTKIFPKGIKKAILKPQGGSSSLMTFLIETKEDFIEAKKNIKKGINYIVEEYFDGELNSIDFYFNNNSLYILAFIKEIPLKDFWDSKKISKDFINKHKSYLNLFNFFIPVRYNEDIKHITKVELDFLSKIRNKLESVSYKGFIHLEYKFNKKTKQIGFIERGARLGLKRYDYISKCYNTKTKPINIPYLIENNQIEEFELKREGIYMIKQDTTDTNILGIRSTFTKKTIIKFGTNKEFEERLGKIIRTYFMNNFKINIQKIDYIISYEEGNTFYPFYENNSTRLDYAIFLDNKNFEIAKENIEAIMEYLLFNGGMKKG